jgi:predicted metal-binding protein
LSVETWITICDTCKRPEWQAEDGRPTDGVVLAGLIEPLAAARGVATRRVSCTMGCERACNVLVQARGKLSYSLGQFAPLAEDAAAIVDYAVLHRDSETGQVPFRQWPQGVKGHFISRQPPLPE